MMAATTCDICNAPIAYGETCYSVPTGATWDVPDQDEGNPVVRIVCVACYDGPARDDIPSEAILQRVTVVPTWGP